MKTVFTTLAMVLLMATTALCGTQSLTFQVDTKGQDIDGVRLFQANKPAPFNMTAPVYEGANTIITVSGLKEGQTYQFVAVIYKGDTVSPNSNLVEKQIPVVIQLQAPGLAIIKTGWE